MTHVHYSSGTLVDGTTAKSYNFGFTAAAGAPLLAVVHAAATATTPTGWTLVGSEVGGTGFYVFTKTATGGEVNISWTQNGGRAAAVSVWEFAPTSVITGVAPKFTSTTSTGTITVYGAGTFLQLRVTGASGNNPTNMTWTGDGAKVPDVNVYSPIDNSTASISAYQIDYTTSGAKNFQGSIAATTFNIYILDNVTSITPTTIAQYTGTPRLRTPSRSALPQQPGNNT